MSEILNDEKILEEIFPNSLSFDRKNKDNRKKKCQWRDVEIAKERLKLKYELLSLRSYH